MTNIVAANQTGTEGDISNVEQGETSSSYTTIVGELSYKNRTSSPEFKTLCLRPIQMIDTKLTGIFLHHALPQFLTMWWATVCIIFSTSGMLFGFDVYMFFGLLSLSFFAINSILASFFDDDSEFKLFGLIPATTKQSPLDFLRNPKSYYETMEKALTLSLDSLHNPTKEESQELLKEVVLKQHIDTPLIKRECHFEESSYRVESTVDSDFLSVIEKLVQTKTGYFVLKQVMQRTASILLKDKQDESVCRFLTVDGRGTIRRIFSEMFFPFLLPHWKTRYPELTFAEYIPKYDTSNFAIDIGKPFKRLCIESDGSITFVKVKSNALTLLHELSHTFAKSRLLDPLRALPALKQLTSIEETKAIMYENMFLKELGISSRRVTHWTPKLWRSELMREVLPILKRGDPKELEQLRKLDDKRIYSKKLQVRELDV